MENSQGVPIGPNGYVICRTCGKEVQEISREVSNDYAYCLAHRPTTKKEKKPVKEKKAKAPRVKGTPQPAIKWFQEQTKETADPEVITAAAKAQKYSDSTISIQLGRLRGMGLLPSLPTIAKATAKAKPAPKPRAPRTFRPQPKPGQQATA